MRGGGARSDEGGRVGVELHKQQSHRKPAGKGHFLVNKSMNRLKLSGSLPDSLNPPL